MEEMQHPENPYLKAQSLWFERDGHLKQQAYNWRLAALGSLLVATILATGMYHTASRSRFIPYVIEVDKLGKVQAVGPADKLQQPNRKQIETTVLDFITNLRALSIDKRVIENQLKRAYDFVAKDSAANTFLNHYFKDNDPFQAAQTQTIDIQVSVVIPVTDSGSSWQAEWTETTRNLGGNVINTTRWKAILTIDFTLPEKDQLTLNPLGIYVTHMSWSKQL